MKTKQFDKPSSTLCDSRKKLFYLCLAAMFATICYILTAYLHIPTNNGITHIGDGIIFLAASLLPLPYAIGAGVTGAMLADLLSGFPIWAPATVIIKAATVFLFTSKKEKILTLRNLIALPFAFIICAAGYTAYEALVISDLKTALVAVPSYAVQITASSALYILLASALDKAGLKKRL